MLIDEIMSYQIDDPDSRFKFSDRLAQENMWSKDYAKRVIEEYKKFAFLGRLYGNVTPSIDVDEAWHLHMIYTRDYWDKFCEVIGYKLHHGPTKGGEVEDNKYWQQYNTTLKHYRVHFGEPPTDIWPPASVRFLADERIRVDLKKYWVIPAGDFKGIFKAIKYYFTKKFKL